jgi:RimJ/RimL family protein N-acetyltransferase
VQSSPHLYDYLPYGPFQTAEDFHKTFFDSYIRDDTGTVLFAVYNKNGPGKSDVLAGCMGYSNSSVPHLAAEIGHVVTLPAFQRTHVTSNAVGLLLHYALDPPSSGGLGLRRVVWQACTPNDKSVRAALRMGFQREATLRWGRILPLGKEKAGNKKGERSEDPRSGYVGIDAVMLSLCWDDWEGGARRRVDDIMAGLIR